MHTPVAGPLRVARAGIVATLVLALAALAHRVAGGTLPDPLVLAALTAFTMAGATAATRFRLTVPWLIVVLGAGQVALHYALGFFSGSTALAADCAPGTAGFGSGHAGHLGAAHALDCLSPAAAATSTTVPDAGAHLMHSGMHSGVPGLWMLVAHAVATLVVALVVARGERALGALIAWLTPRTPVADVVLPDVPRPALVAAIVVHVATRFPRATSSRGPPPEVRPVISTF